jgi:hypothetical protein
MALDAEVSDLLKMEGMAGARESARLSGAVDRNLVQGLGVVNTSLIQQAGGTADDAATMAALRTAIYVPELGNSKAAKP